LNEQAKYNTVKDRSEGIYKEKGSKFIGIAVPCYSEEEAKNFLDTWRKEHHQARHLCYAYRFGLDKSVFRANDDGEPSNSAGAPILGQIQSFDLSNVLLGVVRYYGGTKLGVGGLINAYRTAAKEALAIAEIIEVEVFHHVRLSFSYDKMPELMAWLKHENLVYKNQVFELDCTLEVALPLVRKDSLLLELADFESVEIELFGEY
jgi:uncharacterized YigZ family protein